MTMTIIEVQAYAAEQKKQFRPGMTCEEIEAVMKEQLAFWQKLWADLHPPKEKVVKKYYSITLAFSWGGKWEFSAGRWIGATKSAWLWLGPIYIGAGQGKFIPAT